MLLFLHCVGPCAPVGKSTIAFDDFVRSFPFVLPFFLESIKAVCLRGNRSWRLGSRCQSTRCCRCRNWRNWRRWRWRGCRCCRRRFGAIKEFIKHGNAMVAVAGSGSNRVVFMVGGGRCAGQNHRAGYAVTTPQQLKKGSLLKTSNEPLYVLVPER